MATKAWQVRTPDGEHVVELEHGYFSGKRTVLVDGEVVVEEGRHLIDLGDVFTIPIGDTRGFLSIKLAHLGFGFSYALKVGDQIVPSAD
jgi:hypothetical protein